MSQKVKAILSIGGWSESKYFSSAVATDANRTAFAQAIMKVVSKYKVDGVEFECVCLNPFQSDFIHLFRSWEYPSKQGIGCNIVSASDSANFLLFLQTLRQQHGARKLIISAAVSITPFFGLDGNPIADVSAFAKVLDYIGSLITILNFVPV